MKDAVFDPGRSLSRPVAALPDLARWRFDIQRWIGWALSGAILFAVILQLGRGGIAALLQSPPRAPQFWLVLALLYLTPSIAEWAIFRRLWRLPAVGIVALLRKQVANELVLGYSGDAHFYLWARRYLGMVNSPFGAVKDVAIMSAVAGNAITLILMAASWPLLADAVSGPLARTFAWSVVAIAATSLLLFAMRRHLFSLSRSALATVFAIHVGRTMACLGLLALLVHLMLPSVSLGWLAVIVTLRMMLSRLPLLPAKDLAFASLVATLFGGGAPIVPAILLIGGLIVALHLIVGLLAAMAAFAPEGKAL